MEIFLIDKKVSSISFLSCRHRTTTIQGSSGRKIKHGINQKFPCKAFFTLRKDIRHWALKMYTNGTHTLSI